MSGTAVSAGGYHTKDMHRLSTYVLVPGKHFTKLSCLPKHSVYVLKQSNLTRISSTSKNNNQLNQTSSNPLKLCECNVHTPVFISTLIRNIQTPKPHNTKHIKATNGNQPTNIASNNAVPHGFWKSMENQQKYFDWLGKELGVKELDDWYQKLSRRNVLNHGGAGLLHRYKGSPIAALMAVYPDHNWIPWKFNHSPMRFWVALDNQRKYFDWLAKELCIKNLDDWYKVLTVKLVTKHGGAGMLNNYKKSAIRALMASYPEHNWLPWKFGITMQHYWKSVDNQRRFFDWLGNQLGVQQLDDWYCLARQRTITKHGGGSIMALYRGSPMEALKACYPSHNWDPEKFHRRTMGFWGSSENVSQFLAFLSQKLSIQTLDDWYRVDYVQLKKFGAGRLLKRYGGLYNILAQQYPHHLWSRARFLAPRKAQRWLIVSLKNIYPDTEIMEDYKHKSITFSGTSQPIQLDAFIPDLSLAFEYQGKQHYEDVFLFGSAKQYQVRDQEKRKACADHGIRLVEVPYWWDRTLEALQRIIQGQIPANTAHVQWD